MSLRSGDLVHDRYRIEAPLGSEAVVAYRAYDTLQGQPCVLQVHTPAPFSPADEPAPGGDAPLPLSAQEWALAQFTREAHLLARLDYPHIPKVIEHFVQGGEGYLVTPWVEGRNLAPMLGQQQPRGGAFPEEQVLDWADQLLATLAYCHAHGVVHRDVQPGNILVAPTNWLYLVNFGLLEHAVALSPYTPPERQRGPVGARGDIYGLGATLYALLAGQEPPTALQRQAGAPVPSPGAPAEGAISAGLAAWLAHAMALDPGSRFQSAGEMRLVLNGVRREEGELAALFAAAWGAYRHGRWAKAERLLAEVVRQQPDYRRYGRSAADLLASARERSGQRPHLLLWLGVGVPALAVAGAAALSVTRGLTPAPAPPTATPTATITLSPTASPVRSPTLTVTREPSSTPVTPTKTITPTRTATPKATEQPTVLRSATPPPTDTPLPPSPTAEPPTAEPPAAPPPPPPPPPPTAPPPTPTVVPSATSAPPPSETPVETATEVAPVQTEPPPAEAATPEPPTATLTPPPAPSAGSSPSPTTAS